MTHTPSQAGREPTISVVIPAHDRQDTVGETLDSLLAQTYAGWEAIVIDDGSSDDTAAVVEGYAGRDARIRLQRQANGGVSGARNAGIGLVRAPWTFFLDADDWIVPAAFELLTAALTADPSADAAFGGFVRVDERGRELRRELPALEQDLFPLFARTCAISIHTCLVRSELVRRAGGFDESLVTCEDWDLWQRIARIGARFTTIPEHIAYYRMRVGSASGRGWRMLADGLRVIDRGHGEDLRVASPAARAPLPRTARDLARTYFACYAAGLEIAGGADALEMLDELGDSVSGDVDPHGVAETLLHAISVGRGCSTADWADFPPQIHRHCCAFIDTLGERTGNHWLSFGAREALERQHLAAAEAERPYRTGRWYVLELDLDGPPPEDLHLGPEVERLLCAVRCGEAQVADLELPVIDGWVPARVLADAIVAACAWDVLRAFLERHRYPQLTVVRDGGRARVERRGRVLYDGPLDTRRPPAMALHDVVGWTVLLQDVFDRPWPADDFYAGARRGRDIGERALAVDGGRIALDIAEELPALRVRDTDAVTVELSVAGVPLTSVQCEVSRGRVSAHELRRTILGQTGFELCNAVLREAVLLAPADAGGSLRERLAAQLAARRAEPGVRLPEVTIVGRGAGDDGTACSRWAVLPAAAAAERLALAAREREPVSGPREDVERLLAAPFALGGRADAARLSDDALLRVLEFERVFGAHVDPWDYGSPYEQEKYERTLALLPEGAERTLELGCAEGVFTRMLAARVRELVAVDISARALLRARERCRTSVHVAFEQRDLFTDSLDGRYDLIVCSELLYYAERRETLAHAASKLAAALVHGGHLLTAHAHAVVDDPRSPGFDWDVPFGAAGIEAALLGTQELELEREIRTTYYRVQRYRRRARRLRRRPQVEREVLPSAAPASEHAARFLRDGGAVRREPEADAASADRLPILMYHRVAPAGAAATRRWRLHPDAFEAQLAHLREHGYHALTFEQWRAASDRRMRIPSRSVMLTFDDGYADFTEYALPLLVRYGFRATMFVVTDLVGATNAWDAQLGEPLPLMGWSDLAALPDAGVEVGSHSASHQPLVSLSALELTRDLCRSRATLQERLGSPARALCYPYGLHDAAVLSLAGACGFHYGVTTNEWPASFGDGLLALPRVEPRGTETLAEFVEKLSA